MSNPADNLLSDELAEKLERLLGGPTGLEAAHAFARAAADSGIGIVDTKRARAWIDEKVYEGALRRGHHWRDLAEARAPIPMILFCPQCGERHIDQPAPPEWTNPPHRSHLCAVCGHIWRPADVATVGVLEIETRGKLDKPPPAIAGRGVLPQTVHLEAGDMIEIGGHAPPTGDGKVVVIEPRKPSSEPGLFEKLRADVLRIVRQEIARGGSLRRALR